MPAGSPPSDAQTAVHALAACELVVYALILCAITTLVGSLYFVIMNDGAVVFGHTLLPAVVPKISHLGRTEFRGISPGILGIGWLALTSASAVAQSSTGAVYGPDARGRAYILSGAFVVNILIAVIVIDNTSVAPTEAARTLGWWPMAAIKAVMAVAATGAFMLAFYACRQIGKRAWLPANAVMSARLALFALAGPLFGAALAVLRSSMGDLVQPNLHLLWMHACGFALACLAGCICMNVLRKALGSVQLPIGILGTETSIGAVGAGGQHGQL